MTTFFFIAFSAFLLSVVAAKTYTREALTRFPTGGAGPKAMDWCHANDKITFEQIPMPSGPPYYYDVFTISPDGTDEVCLTCDKPEIPKHNGNPCWSPDTNWIVFTAQNESVPLQYDYTGTPGVGMNTDLFAVSSDGSELHQLTFYGYGYLPWGGFLHPQFSHDGSKLLWAFRKTNGVSFNGGWVIRTADWVVDAGVPRLENEEEYEPGDQSCFYETHAFGATSDEIMFSGNLLSGQVGSGMDIYTYNTASTVLTRLTTTDSDWDEHSHWTPDGEKIVWMSSSGLGIVITEEETNDGTYEYLLRTELWIMDADGSNQERLTYFNTPGHDDFDLYQGAQAIVADSAINAEGDRVVFGVLYNDTSTSSFKTDWYIMDFAVVEDSVSSCHSSIFVVVVVVVVLLFFGKAV